MVRTTTFVSVGLVAVTCLMLLAPDASAQQSLSGVSGVVKDAAGTPVAGVKVEAASPVLIEKVRVALSDGQGQYKIIDLPAGTYDVTFSAGGFITVKNAAIELPSAFNATVNASLKAGNAAEVITVTGLTSQVDTQSVAVEKVISAEQLQSLPTGQASAVQTSSQLTPGLKTTELTDVGGGESAQGQRTNTVTYHGKSGIRVQFDGLRSQNFCGGGYPAYVVNMSMVQDTSVQSGAMSAEYSATGAAVNMVPKSGSNIWKFTTGGLFTNDKLVSDNLSDELVARGLTSTSKGILKYDAGWTTGGPIRKDKIWIFQSNRYYGSKTQWAGIYYNATEGTRFYTNDLSRPAGREEWTVSPAATRITWQVSPRNKLNLYADLQRACTCQAEQTAGSIAPEAISGYHLWPTGGFMATWSMLVNNKLLLEAGASAFLFHFPSEINKATSRTAVSIIDSSNGIRFNAPTSTNENDINYTDRYGQRFSASYVTGSHAFKVGITDDFGLNWNKNRPFGQDANGVNYTFNKGVPSSVSETVLPYYTKYDGWPEVGIFLQDKWTLKRLTVNYGLRYDNFTGYAPVQHADAGPFAYSLPARDYAPVHDIPNWKDITPRVGASYDLFGNGKTAVKFSVAKYLNLTGSNIVSANNPINTSVTSVTRNWTDTTFGPGDPRTGNYFPDCDFANPLQNGECGQISDLNFGLNNPKANRYEDDVLHGWGARVYYWEWGTELQHQIRPGFTVNASWFHNAPGGFQVTDNLLVSPSDYSPYCITAPVDARLPNGGGYRVCGLYDVSVAKSGSVSNLIRKAQFGTGGLDASFIAPDAGVNCGTGSDACGKNDFFGLTLNARVGSGIRLGGGLDVGRSDTNRCFVVDSPQNLLNCHTVVPFSHQIEVKLNATYPLPFPGQWTLSAAYQDNPGPTVTASYPAPTNEILPSLGRNLAACGTKVVCSSTASVPLIAPETLWEARRHQLDLRFAKTFRTGPSSRLNTSIGLYNVANSSSIISINTTYGDQWKRPQAVLAARTLQFQGTLSF